MSDCGVYVIALIIHRTAQVMLTGVNT